jgi:hypothetical protein
VGSQSGAMGADGRHHYDPRAAVAARLTAVEPNFRNLSRVACETAPGTGHRHRSSLLRRDTDRQTGSRRWRADVLVYRPKSSISATAAICGDVLLEPAVLGPVFAGSIRQGGQIWRNFR